MRLALLVICFCLCSEAINAQQANVFKINKAVGSIIAASVDGHDHGDRHIFELNDELFESGLIQKGSRIAFDIAAGEEHVLEVTRVSKYFPGTKSYIARDPDDPAKVFSFTYTESGIQGIYHDSFGRALSFTRDLANGLNYVQLATDHDELACYTSEIDGKIEEFPTVIPGRKAKTKSLTYNIISGINSEVDSVTIDVMFEVTTNAASWASRSNAFQDIDAVLAQAMNFGQTALDNSNTGIELRVVHTNFVSLTSQEQVLSTRDKLTRVAGGSGSFANTHVLRDQYGADLVAFIDEIFDTGGIGRVPITPFASPTLGFSANRVQQIGNGYTLIHEMGHNMGNFHSRIQPTGPAPARGGAFQYSVGRQDHDHGFHTVMAYSAPGLGQAPVFASPDILHRQQPTGILDPVTPENSAQAIKDISGIISSYRSTTEQAPIPGLSINAIDIELATNETSSIPFQVTNTGDSRLMWGIDFKLGETINEAPVPSPEAAVLYQTSFEADEGFSSPGNYSAISNWRMFSSNEQVEISDLSAKDGNAHLNINYTTNPNTRTVAAPFLGSLPLGRYEISMDVRISGIAPGSDETLSHSIYTRDMQTRKVSSGFGIRNGRISTYGAFPGVPAAGEYFETEIITGFNGYRNVKIIMNPDTQKIEYYLDGGLIASNDFVLDTNSPDQLFFEFGNEFPGSFMSVDNVEIKSYGMPYSWIDVPNRAGFTIEGGASETMLNFSAEGLDPGVYEATMQLKTNSAETPVIDVPVKLTVSLSVSNEEDEGIPTVVSLDQNFPNPFNPTTNITFRLNSSSEVSLAVYNMLGQQVATVAQGRFAAGSHTVPFNAQNLSSGVYVYQLRAGNVILNRKLTLIK